MFILEIAYSETLISYYLPQIKIEQLGKGCFNNNRPTEEDLVMAKKALEKCSKVLSEGCYDVVVLTGRYAPLEVMNYADLVTEVKEIKHYFNKGILSRKGIDC